MFTVRALLSPGTFGGHDIVVLERPSGEDAEPGRRERMLRLGLYQQRERLTLVERELRERLDAFERRDR